MPKNFWLVTDYGTHRLIYNEVPRRFCGIRASNLRQVLPKRSEMTKANVLAAFKKMHQKLEKKGRPERMQRQWQAIENHDLMIAAMKRQTPAALYAD